jgi:hypothetical protein
MEDGVSVKAEAKCKAQEYLKNIYKPIQGNSF